MKKFFGFIKNIFKKLWRTITNKWLLKGTTTVALVAIVIAGYIGINWAVEQVKVEDLDFTTKKLYSLSDETKNRLKNLNTSHVSINPFQVVIRHITDKFKYISCFY